MNVVHWAHIAHVFGAAGVFIALGMEVTLLRQLAAVSTVEQARSVFEGYRWSRRIGPPSLLLLIVPGLFLAARVWSWSGPWFQAAIPVVLALFALGGGITGRQVLRLARPDAAVSFDPAKLRRALWTSFCARGALLLAALFLMTAKPALVGTVVTLVTAVAGAWLTAAYVPVQAPLVQPDNPAAAQSRRSDLPSRQ